MKDPRRAPGRPCEAMVYTYTERVGRFWKRQLVGNYVDGDIRVVLCQLPRGVYRVEWRDRKRWVARVEAWGVDGEGRTRRLPPRSRAPRPRRVPPPVSLRAGNHASSQEPQWPHP
jgi:hypothetical protein